MPKLTVLCPCKNEEANLGPCLGSVSWADEILVVDSGSTDGTLAVAREFTDRVLEHEYVNSATQKNWAIPRAAHEWVMVIDADERATPELQDEIRTLLSEEPPLDGYRIPRRNFFFGKRIRHCGWDGDAPLRLFRRDLSRYEEKHVHADVVVEGGRVGRLCGELEHHTYRSFDQYLEKFGRYTTWSALDLKAQGRRATAWSLVVRPAFRFVRQYLFRQGFRDGLPGLILCGLAAFSVFMKYAKLWAIERAERGEPGVETGRTEW